MSPTLKGKQAGEGKKGRREVQRTLIKQRCTASCGQQGPKVCSYHQHHWKKTKQKTLNTEHPSDSSRNY